MSAEEALGKQFGTFKPVPSMMRAKLDVEPEYPAGSKRGARSGPADRTAAAARLLGAGRGYGYQLDMVRKGIKPSLN